MMQSPPWFPFVTSSWSHLMLGDSFSIVAYGGRLGVPVIFSPAKRMLCVGDEPVSIDPAIVTGQAPHPTPELGIPEEGCTVIGSLAVPATTGSLMGPVL